jgi:hypothetical protein
MRELNVNTFELIYDQKEFDLVFQFIRDGFGWSNEFANKMYSLVLSSRKKNTPIAAVNKNNGHITIALLIIFQGYFGLHSREVLNLSSWYAIPKTRGVATVHFAKKLLSVLQKYMITNYTPNEAAGKIFKSIGFKPMNISMVRGGFLKKPPFFSFDSFKILNFYNKNHLVPIKPSTQISDGSRGVRYTLYPRKVMGITFNILNLYQTNLLDWPPSLWHVLKLMICNRALMLVVYFRDDLHIESGAKWLIYDSEGFAGNISPLGSELNIIS